LRGAIVRFTRDLNLSTTTHLIVTEARGAKYEAAVSAAVAASSGAPTVHIVHASWIEECWRQGRLVDYQRHGVIEPKTTAIDNLNDTVTKPASDTSKGIDLERDLDQLLASGSSLQSNLSWTFSSCHCLLAGFTDPMDDMVKDLSGVHAKLCRLLRRHMGTIYWEWNDVNAAALTHVLVPDHCMDETTRYVTRVHDMIFQSRSIDHCRICVLCRMTMTSRAKEYGLALVSPRWVVDSCRHGKLLPISSVYLPELLPTTPLPTVPAAKVARVDSESARNGAIRKRRLPSAIFQGRVFVLLRVAPSADMVDFSSTDLEALVTCHGGQLLSDTILRALQSDGKGSFGGKRTCYVVCWGGGSGTSWSQQEEWHPLLPLVRRDRLCDVISVTPIWLQTSVTEQQCISPQRYPDLFVPTKYPMYKFNSIKRVADGKGTLAVCRESKTDTIRLSITGFSGFRRSSLVHLIQAMGGVYDDDMLKSTTHLLVQTISDNPKGNDTNEDHSRGPKYCKALEWKLQIVDVEWLFQVARHGSVLMHELPHNVVGG
jgi:twin BRCT domain